MTKFKINMSKGKKYEGLITISNDIIKARYKFSLPTQKLMFFLISEISYDEKFKDKMFVKEHRYSLNRILDFFKETGREKDKNLRGLLIDCINEIHENSIEIQTINEYGKMEFKKYPWYSSVGFNEQTNNFEFKFNQEIAPLLLDLKDKFFESDLKEYMKLRSSHAINLYTILRANEYSKDIQKNKYQLDQLKDLMGVTTNKAYNSWINFRRRILENSIEQLNKETNYIFSFDIERVGRKVGFVIFHMFEKKNSKELSNYISERLEQHLKKQKQELFFKDRKLNKITYKYDPQEDILRMNLHDVKIMNSKIKNFEDLENVMTKYFVETKTDKMLRTIFRKNTILTFKWKPPKSKGKKK